MRDALPKRDDGPIVTAPLECLAAVGFVRHAGGAVQRGSGIEVAGVEQVEHVARVVLPSVPVERSRVALPEHFQPADRLCGEVAVHRSRRWREEVLFRGAVKIDEYLRVPADDGPEHGPCGSLRQRDQITVHVESVVSVSPPDAPGLVPFVRERFIGADRERVVPHCEPLVTVRIGGRIHDDQRVSQHLDGGRLVRGEQLIDDPHRGLKAAGLVAVNGEREHDGHRGTRRHRVCRLGAGRPRVGKPGQVGPDLVDPGKVLRSRDEQDAHRSPLFRHADTLDAHPIRSGGDHRVEHGLLLGILRVPRAGLVSQE